MNQYNPDAKCPKCGSNIVKIYYHNQSCHGHNNEYGVCYNIKTEHMLRRCDCCGYDWLEASLDYK